MKDKVALNQTPFTRLVWKGNDIKKEYQPKLQKASKLYHEAEWQTVIQGKRDCGTIHVNKNNYEEILDILADEGLYFKPIERTGKYSGFSHKHREVKEGEDYDVYGVISRKQEKVQEFYKASKEGNKADHYKIGELLQYPACCSRAFVVRWRNGIIDPVFEAAEEVAEVKERGNKRIIELDSVPLETNQFMRYFGLRITSHLPCSLDCSWSNKVSKIWAKTMRNINEEWFEYLIEFLQLPFEWDAKYGILELDTPLFKGITTTGFSRKNKIIRIKDYKGGR